MNNINNKNLICINEDIDVIGIYVHIPFCKQKCKYCNFLSFKSDNVAIKEYINSLKKEIQVYSLLYTKEIKVGTVYIGGGTPSYIDSIYIEEILDTIKNNYIVDDKAEITIEVNPGTVNREKIAHYKKIGINRISIGLQTTCDKELKVLGRIHTFREFEETYNQFRNEGFDNISIDVMSAIPNQTIESYEETLKKIIQLKPNHISSYSLIIEENTPFYELQDELDLVSEDIERKMYYLTKKILADNGYNRYEISNYALDNNISKHNSNYWDITKYYLGFGVGASSYVYNKNFLKDNEENINKEKLSNIVRYNKICNIQEYIKIFANYEDIINLSINDIYKIRVAIEVDIEKVTINNQLEEFMFLGLRKTEGISIKKFNYIVEKFLTSCDNKQIVNSDLEEQDKYKDIFDIYGDIINKYTSMGMLEIRDDNIYLTDKGIDVCNTILADFIGIEIV